MEMTPEQIAIKIFMQRPKPYFDACCCVGPKDGDPVCPCSMQMMVKVDDVYYKITEEPTEDGYRYSANKFLPPAVEVTRPMDLQSRLERFKQAKS